MDMQSGNGLQERIEEVIKEQGLHRSGEEEGPSSVHLLGLGKIGASVIEWYLRDPHTKFRALAVDIDDGEFAPVREVATSLS